MAKRPGSKLATWLAVAVLSLATGCGQDPTPADQVPTLARSLDRVDDAVAAQEYDAARDSLDQLVDTTVQARDNGDLDPGQAELILDAAQRLRSALPGAATEPADPETEPSPEDTSPDPEPTSPEEDEDEADKDDEGKDEGHDKSEGKGKSKDD